MESGKSNEKPGGPAKKEGGVGVGRRVFLGLSAGAFAAFLETVFGGRGEVSRYTGQRLRESVAPRAIISPSARRAIEALLGEELIEVKRGLGGEFRYLARYDGLVREYRIFRMPQVGDGFGGKGDYEVQVGAPEGAYVGISIVTYARGTDIPLKKSVFRRRVSADGRPFLELSEE